MRIFDFFRRRKGPETKKHEAKIVPISSATEQDIVDALEQEPSRPTFPEWQTYVINKENPKRIMLADLRVLIVEDMPMSLEGFRDACVEVGISPDNISLAAGGETAEQKMLTGEYDLVLLDNQLPSKHGGYILDAVAKAYEAGTMHASFFPTIVSISSEIKEDFIKYTYGPHFPYDEYYDAFLFKFKVYEAIHEMPSGVGVICDALKNNTCEIIADDK